MLVLKTTYLMNVSSDLSNNTLYIYVIYLELVLFFTYFQSSCICTVGQMSLN